MTVSSPLRQLTALAANDSRVLTESNMSCIKHSSVVRVPPAVPHLHIQVRHCYEVIILLLIISSHPQQPQQPASPACEQLPLRALQRSVRGERRLICKSGVDMGRATIRDIKRAVAAGKANRWTCIRSQRVQAERGIPHQLRSFNALPRAHIE